MKNWISLGDGRWVNLDMFKQIRVEASDERKVDKVTLTDAEGIALKLTGEQANEFCTRFLQTIEQ